MIVRGGYDLLRVGLRIAVQFWPLWLFWFAWDFAEGFWRDTVLVGSAHIGGLQPYQMTWTQYLLWRAWPAASLLGPAILMMVAVAAYRARLFGRLMGVAGIIGMAVATVVTVRPEAARLAALFGQGYAADDVLRTANASFVVAGLFGVVVVIAGMAAMIRPFPVGSRNGPLLLRARSDNFGHAAWLSMRDAQKLFPGPDPAYGGIVIGEAYRVDEDTRAGRGGFDPREPRTWGRGGTAPLLVDPCHTGPTHALVLAGSGGFKTTSVGIPTLLAWTGSTVVLDPSREIGPMLTDYRERTLGHSVATLDPATAAKSGVNVLDWIDTASPLAETHVEAVVGWIGGEARGQVTSGGEFFRESGRGLIACLLAHILWDSRLPPERKTLRELRRLLVSPEDAMKTLLQEVYEYSSSAMARDLAGTLKGLVKETFSGVYANANKDTRWLSTPAYADLVSGGGDGAGAFRTCDLRDGKLTVFIQIPLNALQATPALGRVIVGALLNAAYEADGRVQGRILFLLDEVARLGYMQVLEQARDAGRKYGITLLLLYQSLGQLVGQWGREGKQAWYDSSSWRLFAAVQDPDTARELSAMCGEYGVVATSTGDSEGSSARAGIASSNSGRSENRSEIKRALIKPDELLQDTRADEAFVLVRGSKPLRCGRAIWFRRPEWKALVGQNRFHQANPGMTDRDAAD